MKKLLEEWSAESYEIIRERRHILAKYNIPSPDKREWMFQPPATKLQITSKEIELNVIFPSDLRRFFELSNGWPFNFRNPPGRFLGVDEIVLLRKGEPKYYNSLQENFSNIGVDEMIDETFQLTKNYLGTEMVIGSRDFSSYFLDPFLGDISAKSSFTEIIIECKNDYIKGLKFIT